MEWAQGIEIDNGALVARVANAEGKSELVSLKELGTRGLPTERSGARRRHCRVDLSRLQPIPSREYLEAFGLEAADTVGESHLVFELLSARKRWLIPSLALIRGIFRPCSILLDEVFRPQMLDRVSYYDEPRDRIEVIAPWANKIGHSGNSDPRALLRWLWMSRAARQLANSVHSFAMDGIIGANPSTCLDLVCYGLERDSTCYVTRLVATSAHPSDTGSGQVIDLFRSAMKRRSPGHSLEAMTQFAGSWSMTSDAEWAVILPILRSDARGRAPKIDLRRVWDLILQEVRSGTRCVLSQEDCAFAASLKHYRNCWFRRRTLHTALEALREMRTHPHPTADLTFN